MKSFTTQYHLTRWNDSIIYQLIIYQLIYQIPKSKHQLFISWWLKHGFSDEIGVDLQAKKIIFLINDINVTKLPIHGITSCNFAGRSPILILVCRKFEIKRQPCPGSGHISKLPYIICGNDEYVNVSKRKTGVIFFSYKQNKWAPT